MPQTLLTLLFLAVAFTKVDPLDPSKLHGEWYHAYEFPDGRIYEGISVYRSDGTFSDNSKILLDGKQIDELRIEGTWEIKGRHITYKGKVIGHPTIPESQPDITCEITEITEDSYSWKSPWDGIIYSETRINNG